MRVIQLLSAGEASEMKSKFSDGDFSDGKATAHGAAADLKRNRQILSGHPVMIAIWPVLRSKLFNSVELTCYAYPQQFVGVRLNTYGVGDYYGWHVDLASMEGVRTDLSFTLFLSNSDDYEGGELELNHGTHISRVKGEAGQIVIYPTGVLHQVKPVTKGRRTAIIGWIRSHVKYQEQRELLLELILEISKLRKKGVPESDLMPLNYCYQGLVRTLSD